MRIAFVYDAIYPYTIGGVEKRIWELSRRLVKRGHEVHIFGMKFWDAEDCIEQEGVFIHGVCAAKKLYHQDRRSVTEAIWFGLHIFSPLFRCGRFDVIDCQSFPFFSCFPVKLVSILRKTKLVITWHEVWGDYWYEYLGWRGVFGRITEVMVSRLTPYNIAVSETTRRQLQGIGVRTEIAIVPNGIDFELIQSISPSDVKSDIIFVGRLIKEKHVDLLIRAVLDLKKCNCRIKCNIIGDGPELHRLYQISECTNLLDNITFYQKKLEYQDIISLIKASKIYCSLSIREGFGIAALEAFACGIPIITNDHPRNAIQEFIDWKTGIIVDSSEKKISEAIFNLLNHNFNYCHYCHQLAIKFDWSNITQKIEDMYKKVLF